MPSRCFQEAEVLQRLCELPADAEPRIERAGLLDVADDCLVPAPDDARRRRPTSAVRRRRDRNTQVEIEEDCLWDVEQEAEWRERRFLQVADCVERQRGPPRHAISRRRVDRWFPHRSRRRASAILRGATAGP